MPAADRTKASSERWEQTERDGHELKTKATFGFVSVNHHFTDPSESRKQLCILIYRPNCLNANTYVTITGRSEPGARLEK
jgi:hypothetical protein